MKTLIIGIGNPILSDDGIGVRAARKLAEELEKPGEREGKGEIEVEEASTGGLILVEMMLGYHRVIMIDAIKTEEGSVGKIYRMVPEDLAGNKETVHASSIHDVSFSRALDLWRERASDIFPSQVIIYAVEVADITTFSEQMSPEVEKALPRVVDMVLGELEG